MTIAGIVFAFLVILIICVTLVGKVIQAIGADTDVNRPVPAASLGGASTVTAPVIAAITAAVTEYRKTEGR
jgi:sodium pump decarboxylase gamma subunit